VTGFQGNISAFQIKYNAQMSGHSIVIYSKSKFSSCDDDKNFDTNCIT
jgi:hypothetical protein